jgi:integrase
MAKTLSRKRDGEPVRVFDVIDDLRDRAPRLKKNSYYFFRAAILQELRDWFSEGTLSPEKAQALVDRLKPDSGVSVGARARRGRTSSQRRRHVQPETISTLATMARSRCHPTFDTLASLLENGIKVGTRPSELIGARLDGRRLYIKSAKVSAGNNRGLAAVRVIGLLDDFDDFDLEELQQLLGRLSDELAAANGDRTRLVRRYAGALRRLRDGKQWASRITLRTTRSQCRANLARGGYMPAEVASILGHASAETAASNYGRANKGWRPIPGHQPLAISTAMLAKVRPGARVKAKLARNQPLTATAARAAHRQPAVPDPSPDMAPG